MGKLPCSCFCFLVLPNRETGRFSLRLRTPLQNDMPVVQLLCSATAPARLQSSKLHYCTIPSALLHETIFCFVVQTILSLRGYDIPLGRTTVKRGARHGVFDIIAPYFLSAKIMRTVEGQIRKKWPSDRKHLLILVRRKGCCTQA